MKNNDLLLLAIGAFALYYFYQRSQTQTSLPKTAAAGGGGGASGAGGGGGAAFMPAGPQIIYQQIPVAITPKMAINQFTRPLVQAQSAVLPTNTGNVAGFDNYGIFGLCDTSNKLTMYGTNNNFNAATLKY